MFSVGLKFEIRNTKHETNPNDPNTKFETPSPFPSPWKERDRVRGAFEI
jgi:hypothetical protein